MKHGDMYTAEDGRELMAVETPDNSCFHKSFWCELGDECAERSMDKWFCGNHPIIFVDKEKYLTYKLLGTAESSG